LCHTNRAGTNGNRINVGLYGNTAEASKSSEEGALVPLTLSDGGTVRNTVELYWAWNGLEANEGIYVDFSADGGDTWTNILTNGYASWGTDGISWDTTNFQSTAMGVWRVCTTNGLCGQTETPFAVKNDPLFYYVNDGSTNNDVYCTAPGMRPIRA
jgi:hypothetical protein